MASLEKTILVQNITVLLWRQRLLDDPYHSAYHFVVPESGCIPADPNGAICWNGRCLLGDVYQDEAGQHIWGHASSLDLLPTNAY